MAARERPEKPAYCTSQEGCRRSQWPNIKIVVMRYVQQRTKASVEANDHGKVLWAVSVWVYCTDLIAFRSQWDAKRKNWIHLRNFPNRTFQIKGGCHSCKCTSRPSESSSCLISLGCIVPLLRTSRLPETPYAPTNINRGLECAQFG